MRVDPTRLNAGQILVTCVQPVYKVGRIKWVKFGFDLECRQVCHP